MTLTGHLIAQSPLLQYFGDLMRKTDPETISNLPLNLEVSLQRGYDIINLIANLGMIDTFLKLLTLYNNNLSFLASKFYGKLCDVQ